MVWKLRSFARLAFDVLAVTRIAICDRQPAIYCPSSCADLFGRLKEGAQDVSIQLRGEPKSGTTTSGRLAWTSLGLTCVYLRTLYGQQCCRVEGSGPDFKMVFEPALVPKEETTQCSCSGVTRVQIEFSSGLKHTLPVPSDCAFSRKDCVAQADDEVCRRRDSLQVENVAELWQCVEEAKCTFNDERLQLAVMRDPRAATVSAYFHQLKHFPASTRLSVDDFFQKTLRPISMWVSVRYLLFTELLADQSEVFWFEDLADPVDWFARFTAFAGLNLPPRVASSMAHINAAAGINDHPGGHTAAANRTFTVELGPKSLAMMDDVMRQWMPSVLLQRFGIEASLAPRPYE